MVKINDFELAKEVINLKIAKELKSDKYKDIKQLEEKVALLNEEERQVNLGNEEVIQKVLTQYLDEVKVK